jgi:hypothetical protein
MSALPARQPRAAAAPRAARPQSDGRRVLFEVVMDGQVVPCAIAQHALRDLVTGGKRTSPGDLMRCFDTVRPQVEALALRKLRARRGTPQGVLYIWPDDAEDEATG